MGSYGVMLDEFALEFEMFLTNIEGDVSAKVVADAWNELAHRYGWNDFLTSTDRLAALNDTGEEAEDEG